MIQFGVSRLQDLVELKRTDAPLAVTTDALMRFGAALSGADASGTYLGINAPAGYTGNFLHFAVDNVQKHLIGEDGRFGFGTGLSSTIFGTVRGTHTDTNNARSLQVTEVAVNTTGSRTNYGYFVTLQLQASAGDLIGAGCFSQPLYEGVSATTQSGIYGFDSAPGLNGVSPTGVISEVARYRANTIANVATGAPAVTITDNYGFLIENQGAGHGVNGLSITNAHGIRIRNQTGAGTLSRAITVDGGACVFNSGAAGVTPLALDGAVSQIASMFLCRNSGGTIIARVASDGTVGTKAIESVSQNQTYISVSGDFASSIGIIGRTTASNILLIVRGMASQSGNLQQWRDSANVVLLSVAAAGHLTFGEAVDIIAGTVTGTKIGTSVSQKLGAFNATPVVQPASANQAALTDSTGGTADGTLVDVGAAYSQANINNNFADVARLLNRLRNDLTTLGWIKGSA